MTKYLVLICADTYDHFTGWALTGSKISRAGISSERKKWNYGHGSKHAWIIDCSEDELLALSLIADVKILKNMTDEYKKTGLEKLTDDEKEALGLL